MMNLPLASIAGVLINFVAVIWLLCALLLIFIILIQKGKGGGLGGAFGGAGGGGGLLGTKTGDFLTWVTIGLVFLFFFLAIILVKFGPILAKQTGLDGPQINQTAPLGTGNEGETTTEGSTDGEGTTDGEGSTDADTSTDSEESGGGSSDGDGDSSDME